MAVISTKLLAIEILYLDTMNSQVSDNARFAVNWVKEYHEWT